MARLNKTLALALAAAVALVAAFLSFRDASPIGSVSTDHDDRRRAVEDNTSPEGSHVDDPSPSAEQIPRLTVNGYSARNRSELERALRDMRAVDRFILESATREFCERPATRFQTTRAMLVEIYGNDPVIGRSADNLDVFRLRFCDQGMVIREVEYELDPLAEFAKAVRGDSVGELIANAKFTAANGGASDTELSRQRVQLAEVVRSTDSRGEFLEAANTLAMPGMGEWDDVPAKPGRAAANSQAVRQFGNMLAACDLFGGCGSDSILTMKACMPIYCDNGATAQSVAGRLVAPDVMDAARAYADALMQFRSEKRG